MITQHRVDSPASVEQRPLAFSYVRFSSEKQRQGASLERQTEAARRWADENGYVLSTTTFEDLAVSAFKGDNSSAGRLAAFLAAVESGAVPTGSVLLVENLDRISRQKIRKARNTLEEIIDAGVDVVTLANNKRYSQNDLDEDAMTGIEIILTFQRAHEESLTKSKRVRHGWQRNLEQVREGKRLRSRAIPNWLKLVGTMDDGQFEIIEDRAAVTRELFSRFADGDTVWSIAKSFRDRGIKTPRGKTFASGNIYRLVKSKAPYGILEIGRGTKNDRTVFDQKEDYFPRIVDEDVQRRVRMRLNGIAQRKEGNRIVNNPKRRTHGILTGVIRTKEGERCVCRKGTDGSFAYVETTTRRWLASRNVIESRFLNGWSEIVAAHQTDSNPEIESIEAALATALGDAHAATKRLEEEPLSPRFKAIVESNLLAAEANIEELQGYLKDLRRGQALAAQEVPDDLPDALQRGRMEPWEANQWVRMIIEQVTVLRGDKKRGPERKTMLIVTLKNGATIDLGDTELMFQ
ncbi:MULTISPECIES: recombinase family protein [Sulfitobacter]|uniref:recombinase family protein n=1 Tax=Sulfitobacter TaxID=60136 RepID=UPI0023075E13|nr:MULTISPECIES: recombinase family protein [Sulfitobacter]MDF3382552.1 recombinase family protein [Sulfitobacter sp. Ks11]MDF3385971.1 recombinase family protein [Sulfitobacter sp. M85]MDF3389390.1 recombinase family protein [Sulfitobacter sp. Ks16]MDF3400027.1 recombinase family protein [Sulfitobacter sp. KE39]MDF3403448.1 recombinase family protein [Sulfitobacter sp. Ks35]